MNFIDYAEVHKITIPEQSMGDIYELIEPETYLRLYNKSNEKIENEKENRSKNSGRSSLKEQSYENKELQDALKEEENRSKNLMSLSILYQRVRKSPYRNGYCIVSLNTLLAFELFITLSHWINKYTADKEKLNDEMENLDMLSPEYQNKNEKWVELNDKIENLKPVNNKVAASLKVENIYALSIAYNRFTPAEHAKKCVI